MRVVERQLSSDSSRVIAAERARATPSRRGLDELPESPRGGAQREHGCSPVDATDAAGSGCHMAMDAADIEGAMDATDATGALYGHHRHYGPRRSEDHRYRRFGCSQHLP